MTTREPPLAAKIERCGSGGGAWRSRRWTDSQQALFNSLFKLTVAWGANGIGKSVGIAELVRKAIECELPWQRPGPQTIILCGKTWTQIGSTVGYLWELIDHDRFKAGIRFEAGGLKGQRLQVFDIVSGPAKGGQLRLGTFDAKNLAGPRADMVVTDEPLPEDVYNELWPRLLGRDGRMYITFTPTIGTAHKIDYLWEKVDNPNIEWAGELQTELTLDAVTPRGGLFEIPWMTQAEIDQQEQGVSRLEADMRMGRTRTPRQEGAYFSAWGPHLLSDSPTPPAGTPLGIGIDHGSKPGAQRATLVAVGGSGLYAKVWILDHYMGNGRTNSEDDAAGILEMLSRNGYTISDVDLWVGDRAHHGDYRGGKKSNMDLKAAIAEALGINTRGRGWHARLPKPLQRMQTPRKYDNSVWEGCKVLFGMMVGDTPRLQMNARCGALNDDFSQWQGSFNDPHKDGIDSVRYIVVPMAEGKTR